jgi:hypothetical protein
MMRTNDKANASMLAQIIAPQTVSGVIGMQMDIFTPVIGLSNSLGYPHITTPALRNPSFGSQWIFNVGNSFLNGHQRSSQRPFADFGEPFQRSRTIDTLQSAFEFLRSPEKTADNDRGYPRTRLNRNVLMDRALYWNKVLFTRATSDTKKRSTNCQNKHDQYPSLPR